MGPDQLPENFGRTEEEASDIVLEAKETYPKITTITARQEKEPSIKPDFPDFTHVKSVVERLTYFPLTASDKKQVQELERTIVRAENGEDTPELKNKINDGLGALLKIMSKYGV